MKALDAESLASDSVSGSFDVVNRQDAQLPQQELDKILKWLEPTNYDADSSELNRHLLSRAPGTGAWLSETDRYCQWQQSLQHGSLWIKGVPGAGKSVLAASIVRQLRESEETDVPVLFFFFRHIVRSNRYSRCLMRDWLAQLLPQSIPLQGILHPLTKSQLRDVSDSVLWECVLKGLAGVPKAFCIVDAMDEMDTTKDSASFFHRLNGLATFRPATIKVLMTSRARQDLQVCLAAASIVHISLEEERVGKEIEVFISYRLAQTMAERPLSTRETLAREIAARSRGLFLYARLLIDQVLPQLRDDREIDIDALPLHLGDMYNQMLSRQAKETGVHRDVQVALLGFITHCARPLRLRELAGLLDTVLQIGPLDKSKKIARIACHPLVQIMEDETVQVIHHSFSEFLLDSARKDGPGAAKSQFPVLNPPEIHRNLAIACLDVQSRAMGLIVSESDGPDVCLPFFRYARENWALHVSYKKDVEDAALFASIEAFCTAERRKTGPKYHVSYVKPGRLPMHVAAETGLITYARILAADGHESWWIAIPDDMNPHTTYPTPIQLACFNGHAELMCMLWPLETTEGNRVDTSEMVKTAVSRSDAAVLQALLDRGVKPSLYTEYGGSTYFVDRLKRTSPDCLRLLVPHLSEDVLLETLWSTAVLGSDELLAILLSDDKIVAKWPEWRGIESKWSRDKTGTALFQACAATDKSAGHVRCVELLLPSFPDINSRETVDDRCYDDDRPPQRERTVLHALAGSWNDDNHEHSVRIFDLLLRAGADLEAKDAQGDTPVLCLFPKTWVQRVAKPLKHILDAGADVNAQGREGGFLIHRAVRKHTDVQLLETLVEHGADVNAAWEDYLLPTALGKIWDLTNWDALFYPWDKAYDRIELSTRKEMAEFLVRNGATIDAGGRPCDVLSAALKSCDVDSFRTLLSARSANTPIDDCFFNIIYRFSKDAAPKARSRAPKREAQPFIQALIDAGVSLEIKDTEGATPLLKSVGNKELFDTFVRLGARKDATDNQGRGVLHHLIHDEVWESDPPMIERLRELVDLGFDPLQTDNDGNSLLHLTIPLYSANPRDSELRDPWLFPFFQQLIDYGLSIRATNKSGLTPLHCFFDEHFEQPDGPPPEPAVHLQEVIRFCQTTTEGIDINARDADGVSCLHLAAMESRDHAALYIRTLLDHGADLRLTAEDGRNALHFAARARNPAIVEVLIDCGPDLVHVRDKQGRTPLFDACVSGVVESVGYLLRAGADVSILDNEGWTLLHACAEFAEEHRKWTIHEARARADEPPVFDRYRPYVVTLWKPTNRFGHYVLPQDWGSWHRELPFALENPELSIYAVVCALVAHGADPSRPSKQNSLSPAQRASELQCKGVEWALASCGHHDSSFVHLACSLAGLGDEEREAVLKDPWSSIAKINPTDITWLKEHNANFFRDIMIDPQCSSPSLSRCWSFLECVVLTGLTEVMVLLGDAARIDSDPNSTPIDKGTLDFITDHATLHIPAAQRNRSELSPWDPSSIKSVGDYLQATNWTVYPLLNTACQRSCPNMEMLQALVERCGANPNGSTVWYYRSPRSETTTCPTTLQYLASKQHFWHLEAIRYLVGKGADVNARDLIGMTALHRACATEGPWTDRFVRLLLDLGADPSAQDVCHRTSLDVVKSAQALRVFAEYGIDISERVTTAIWLGIGQLDAEIIRAALDSGADVNREDQNPGYTVEELDWEIHDTPIGENLPTFPLMGALCYQDYLQKTHTAEGVDRRAACIRVLIDRGADLFAPCTIRRAPINTEGGVSNQHPLTLPLLHFVFQKLRCERTYLDVFFEYKDRIDWNRRDCHGRTLLLAACGSSLEWTDLSDKDTIKSDAEAVVDTEREEAWDSTGFFLRMLDCGADIEAVDSERNTVLHILEFLRRPESHAQVQKRDKDGFTPIQHALRILRPATVDALLSLGASLTEADPKGLNALHHIARQCLTTRVGPISTQEEVRRHRLESIRYLNLQPPDFLERCKGLWRRCLDAGLDIDGPDGTPEARPPLFHYLLEHADTVCGVRRESGFRSDLECHAKSLDDFFASANFHARDGNGDTVLHVLARGDSNENEIIASGRTRNIWGKTSFRPLKHDAEVFRLLVVEKGVDPLAEDRKGRSSLDLAAQLGQDDILEVFKQRG